MTFSEWIVPASLGWGIGIVMVLIGKVLLNEIQNYRFRNVKGGIIGPEPPTQKIDARELQDYWKYGILPDDSSETDI